MPDTLELISNQAQIAAALFANKQDYVAFRESFMAEVIPQQEEWLKARRKSEEEARQRLLG